MLVTNACRRDAHFVHCLVCDMMVWEESEPCAYEKTFYSCIETVRRSLNVKPYSSKYVQFLAACPGVYDWLVNGVGGLMVQPQRRSD